MMWGEDSSGQRVSLLNDSASATTNHNHKHKQQHRNSIHSLKPSSSIARPDLLHRARPTLPDRSRHPTSSSSSSVASSKGAAHSSSSRSSCSRSPPGRSPPTPPLTRLDSLSSIASSMSAPSPMTPNYGFELDQPLGGGRHANLSSYGNFAKAHPFQDAQPPTPYYHLPGQQPLPPMMDLEDPYSPHHHPSLHRLQTQQMHSFSTDPSLHQLSPNSTTTTTTTSQAHLISPTASLLPPSTTSSTNGSYATSMQPPQPAHGTGAGQLQAAAKSHGLSNKQSSSNNASKASSGPNAPNPQKKKYPCPHAAAFHCSDTFTTSGHAARHGKKHTGEKNVQCPTCGKAFTRKDNMKQHERTHKGATNNMSAAASAMVGTPNSTTVRNTGGSGSASPAISITSTKTGGRSRRTSDVILGSDVMEVDSVSVNSPLASQHQHYQFSNGKGERPRIMRSELSEILENVSAGGSGMTIGLGMNGGVSRGMTMSDEDLDADGEGESPGLDALAMAAGAAA